MRAGPTFALLVTVMAVTIPVEAPAKLISLDERCRCAGEWRDHTHYVRCIKRNAKRYLRFEAWITRPNGRRRIPKAELRAAARARVTQAFASRCGMPEYLCDADRPCAAGEVCDIRGCDATVGVCVPVPESQKPGIGDAYRLQDGTGRMNRNWSRASSPCERLPSVHP